MLDGKTILITGAFGHLGTGLVETFCQKGAHVILGTRDRAKADAFNDKGKRGLKATAFHLPVDEEAGLREATAIILDKVGRIDGLVNNAYPLLDYRAVGETPWSHWATAAQVSLAAPETLSSLLVERRDVSKISSIVNVASIYGLRAPRFDMYLPGQEPSAAYYGAMKAGLIALTRYLATLWAPLNIRVNSISPGGIAGEQNPEFLKRYGNTVPMKRMVSPEEVAATVGFLLSDSASGVTGTDVVVDAGKTIW